MVQPPKRVLVSGCSGQDGSYMADYLLANTPHTVYGMVRRTAKPDYSNLTNAFRYGDRFKLVTGDLSDSTSIDNVVKEVMPDYFINLAAQSFVGSSWSIPEQTFDVDATGVIRCLEAIRKHVPHCRFYNAGSSEEYGSVVTVPQDETHPPRARSPYGAAKVAARQIVKVYRESYGLYAIQGLLFNHESERRGEEFVTRKVTLGVARIVKAIRDGQPFEPIELGNIDAKRDWSHAEDFVDGIWRMLNQDETRELAEYVLSSNETHTVRSFIEKAFAVAGISNGVWVNNKLNDPSNETFRIHSHEAADRAEYEGDHDLYLEGTTCLVRINPEYYRPAEVDLLLGDSTRARKELGWAPKVSFDQLVERMVRSDCAAQGVIL